MAAQAFLLDDEVLFDLFEEEDEFPVLGAASCFMLIAKQSSWAKLLTVTKIKRGKTVIYKKIVRKSH